MNLYNLTQKKNEKKKKDGFWLFWSKIIWSNAIKEKNKTNGRKCNTNYTQPQPHIIVRSIIVLCQ